VNIVSLGAGFDTLFFRLMAAQEKHSVRFVEVDCSPIVSAKAALLRERTAEFFPDADAVANEDATSDGIAYTCNVGDSAAYALFACDLGDTETLARRLDALRVDTSLPTLVIAECVVVRLLSAILRQCLRTVVLTSGCVLCLPSHIWSRSEARRC